MSWLPGKKYFEGGICNIVRDLSNKVIIITGSSSGIGRETAKGLAGQKATIIMATRNQAKTEPIMEEIRKETGNPNIEFIPIDLSDLKSIKAFAQQFKKKYDHLDVLVNNAGANSLDPKKQFTKDGFELNFGSNYIGHYYLTRLLMETLKRTKESRIIFVSTKSATKKGLAWDDFNQDKNFDNFNALFQSKIASLIFANDLQRRLERDNVKVVSLHPGWVRTETWDNVQAPLSTKMMLSSLGFCLKYFGKNSYQGAQTSLYCALQDFGKLKSGGFYSDCEEYRYTPPADHSEENGKRLWDVTERLIKEKLGEDAFEI